MEAVTHTQDDNRIILAGDLNCRIDKPNVKTELILETMAEEGFILINKPDLKTYIAPNGTSTIDLVFCKGENTKTTNQEGLWSSAITPLRKHIPIVTTIEIHQSRSMPTTTTTHKSSRKLDTEQLN